MTRLFCCLVLTCLLAGLSTGCSSLSMNRQSLPTGNADNGAGSYTVQLHKEFGASKSYTGQIDDSTTVQKALEDSGATSQFRSMEVDVMRKVAESGRVLKMPVEYQPRSKTVAPEQDYAIHAGDQIVVRPKSNSGFDNIIKTVFGTSF